ncbi:reverse transcriptase domain-containing protein [Tanacetum coccineum]
MDEFCGGNITIFVQRDHRKAKCEENLSSPINCSQNAKIPGPRRDTHSTEQQDNPTGMHDGLRTGSTTFQCHSGSRRKNQSGHSSGIPKVNYLDMTYLFGNVREGCSPVRQRKRSQTPEKNKAIQEEVEKLNVGATYQRLVDKAFQKQIGINLEVYVDDLVYMDDLVIKSRTKHEIMRDIEETFKTLREININLNPNKCTFGIEEGVFLGYKVNTKEIKVCPDKVEAVLSLPSSKCLKDIQKLNGKLASLNKFLSKSAEKSLPFFKT